MSALALVGWLLAAAAVWRAVRLHRRLELVACAEHELRGPLGALTLAAGRAGSVSVDVLQGQLERARAALADLAAARDGHRAPCEARRHDPWSVVERAALGWRAAGGDVTLDWRAGPTAVDADPERLSQALGNLLSNALEHGGGRVLVRGSRIASDLRIEIADCGPGFLRRPRGRKGRGRGLAIAARAVEEAGGRMRIRSDREGSVVALELPVADA